MTYQRAVILRSTDIKSADKLVGRLLWIVVEPPKLRHSIDHGNRYVGDYRTYRTNITWPGDARPLMVTVDDVELLPEFADNVPTLTFEEWSHPR